ASGSPIVTSEGPPTTTTTQESIAEKTAEIAHKMNMETWQLVAILVGVAVVVLGICFCCIRRCFRKRRSKDGKKGMKGVDFKSVQLLGSAYKEKPDMEELTENAEEPDDGDSKKEEQKLGKIQYKVCDENLAASYGGPGNELEYRFVLFEMSNKIHWSIFIFLLIFA
ncbi:jg17765, partial [Pararge aegeria aegeria]